MSIYITGDTHRNFNRIFHFAKAKDLSSDDLIIILGDAGINFLDNWKDRFLKEELTKCLPVNLFCLHGNHEIRPQRIRSYKETIWMGGKAYIEPDYPSLIFAKDGEIYTLDGLRTLAAGGALSIDKGKRIAKHEANPQVVPRTWWPDEQPSKKIKKRIKARLEKEGWRIDVILSHTCPMRIWREIASESRLEGHARKIEQLMMDMSTEEFLGELEERLDYKKWFFGHFHINRSFEKFQAVGYEIFKFNADPQKQGYLEED